MSNTPDITFALAHDKTHWIVIPQTPAARDWMAQYLPDGREYTTIDHRNLDTYREMAAQAGLLVDIRQAHHPAMSH